MSKVNSKSQFGTKRNIRFEVDTTPECSGSVRHSIKKFVSRSHFRVGPASTTIITDEVTRVFTRAFRAAGAWNGGDNRCTNARNAPISPVFCWTPSGTSLRRHTRVVDDEWETPFYIILYIAPVLLQCAHNIIV